MASGEPIDNVLAPFYNFIGTGGIKKLREMHSEACFPGVHQHSSVLLLLKWADAHDIAQASGKSVTEVLAFFNAYGLSRVIAARGTFGVRT